MSNPRLYASASKNPPKDILACSLTVIMEKKDFEEKRAQYNELMTQCKAIYRECSKMLPELGYSAIEVPLKIVFENNLLLAGFSVSSVEEVEGGGPGTYIVKVERLSPKVHSGNNPDGGAKT